MRNYLKVPKTSDPELVRLEKQLFPSILVEQASSVFMGIVNIIIMGFVSQAALAGVGQINSLNSLIFFFFNSLATGGTVMVAQNIGAKNREGARQSFLQALVSGGILSIVVLAVCFLVRTPLLNFLFGASGAEVMESSRGYFNMSIFATPLWFMYYQIAGAMRGSGDTKTPMRANIMMNIVNLAFSTLFVLVLDMGPAGAGIALVCSVGAGMLMCLFTVTRGTYHLRLPSILKYRPDFKAIKLIYGVGIPVALENLMFNGGRLIVQVFISAMGTDMITAYQVANSISQIFQMPLNASQLLIVTVIGQFSGAGGKKHVRETLNYYNSKIITWSIYVGAALLVFSYPVILLFTRVPAVIGIVYGMLAIYGLFMPFFTFSFVTPSGFRGARDTKFSLVIGTLTMWIVRVGGSYVFGVLLGWQAYGIYFAMCLDWVFRTVAFYWWYKRDTWLRFVSD